MEHPTYKLLYADWRYEGEELLGLFEECEIESAIDQYIEKFDNVKESIKRFYTEDITLNAFR